MRSLLNNITRTQAAGIVVATIGLGFLASPTAAAEAKKTPVTGVEENYQHVPGQWFGGDAGMFVFRRACVADENIDDSRLKGRGTFNFTVDAGAGTYWGTALIVPDIRGGEWNGYWTAIMSPVMTIRLTLQGSGDYAGLVARLNYTPGTEPNTLQIEGYIVEAKRGPGDRPFATRACRTERLEVLDCVELDPSSWPPTPFDPPRPASIARAEIVMEEGQATHAGHISNAGFAVVDPETGLITGMGSATAANGDELFWVYVGAFDQSGVAQGSVHFCGGTGHFDAAVGGFAVELEDAPEPTNDPSVSAFCYNGSGTIRY